MLHIVASHLLALRVVVHMQGTQCTLAKLASHPMPEHVDRLNSLVQIKLKHPFPAAINHAYHVEIQVPLVFKSAINFFIID